MGDRLIAVGVARVMVAKWGFPCSIFHLFPEKKGRTRLDMTRDRVKDLKRHGIMDFWIEMEDGTAPQKEA